MESIDYAKIWSFRTMDEKLTALEDEVARVGYVNLSDMLTHMKSGGHLMMEYMGKREIEDMYQGQQMRFKLRAFTDEWGTPYRPGDVIKRRITKPYKDHAGRKFRSTAINDMKRRGEFDRRFIIERKAVVDEKGCIDVGYDDACYWLSEYGTHYKSGEALCGRRQAMREPCLAPDGTMKIVVYWRFQEAPPDVYETLPRLDEHGRPIIEETAKEKKHDFKKN